MNRRERKISLRRTPLYEVHKELKAKLIDFSGWEMPLSYSGVLDEHESVRARAGIFDISHMGRLRFQGPQAGEVLQHLLTRNVAKLVPGSACYSVLCNSEGGILDDVVVYEQTPEDFLLVVNASNRVKILNWCRANIPGPKTKSGVKIQDCTDTMAMVALQGPATVEILSRQDEMRSWRFLKTSLMDRDVMMATTGYTGERGVEIFVDTSSAVDIWRGLMNRGAALGLKPVGLGARDTLRLEMGYALYGNDIDEQTTPLEAGLDWVVDLNKSDFIGKEALQRQHEKGIKKRLIGFWLLQPGVPRQGYKIYSDGKQIGQVTSGNISPMLSKGIGMGYVQMAYAQTDAEIFIEIRDKDIPAVIVQPPFYRKK